MNKQIIHNQFFFICSQPGLSELSGALVRKVTSDFVLLLHACDGTNGGIGQDSGATSLMLLNQRQIDNLFASERGLATVMSLWNEK